MKRRHFHQQLLAIGMLPLAAHAGGNVSSQVRPLMGTRVRIVVRDGRPARRDAALDAAWQAMHGLAASLSRFRPDSLVAALNRHAGRSFGVPVSPFAMGVLQAAREVSRATGGAFDITVGAYDEWRFDPPDPARVPSAAMLQAQRPRVGHDRVMLDVQAMTARLTTAGMKLDLGGIAKLPILHAGLEVLRAQGIEQAMIDGGGDVMCFGGLHDRAWRVGLRNPLAPQRLAGVLEMHDGVVASSGDYERGFDRGGVRYHHVLDPRSGMPARGLRGVALTAPEPGQVNGLGAAMMVAGAAAARQWLARRPAVQAMLADDAQGLWWSPGLAGRVLPAEAT